TSSRRRPVPRASRRRASRRWTRGERPREPDAREARRHPAARALLCRERLRPRSGAEPTPREAGQRESSLTHPCHERRDGLAIDLVCGDRGVEKLHLTRRGAGVRALRERRKECSRAIPIHGNRKQRERPTEIALVKSPGRLRRRVEPRASEWTVQQRG